MEIGFVNIARAQPARGEAPQNATAARDVARVSAPAKSGLQEPFSASREEASVVRAQLEAEAAARDSNTNALTDEEQAVVDQLAARDREVRNHEEAHARVGGQYAGNPRYSYQQGPYGKQYAIGGEVAIDVAAVPDDPEATIIKMEIVKAAALAPAEPSGQDRKVAALADAQRQQAIADLAELRRGIEPAPEPVLDIAA